MPLTAGEFFRALKVSCPAQMMSDFPKVPPPVLLRRDADGLGSRLH